MKDKDLMILEESIRILLFKLPGGETRKRILCFLSVTSASCNSISKEIGISWWGVKKQLDILERHNLVKKVYVNRRTYYEITEIGFLALKFQKDNVCSKINVSHFTSE